MDRVGVQGAHPCRGHLSRRALAAGDVRRARRRLPDLSTAPRHEPGALHVLRADAGDGAGGVVARTARSRRGPARVGAPDRRDPAARADRDPRPAPGARAARRSEGAVRARDAGGPRPQRSRTGVRRGLGPPDRADGGRAVHQGDAHRVDGRGRAPRGPPSARRLGGDVPGGDRDRRAEAPGDGADRGARAHRARSVRGRGRIPHVRGRPRLLHHDPDGGHHGRPRVGADRRRRGRRLRPGERAAGDEGEGGRASSRGLAGGRYARRRAGERGGTSHDPHRRSLRLVHLQPRAARREPGTPDGGREVRRGVRGVAGRARHPTR